MTKLKIGAASAARIEETYEPNFKADKFFPDWDAAFVAKHMGWLAPDHYIPETGYLKLSVHSWLLTIGGKKILIDACVGNHKPRPHRPKWDMLNTPYLARLEAAGAKPEDIDMVMCTHLHIDHIGWNTRLDNGRWVPTFPNARYVFSREDYEHYLAEENDPSTPPAGWGSFRDSILPVVEAGLAQMVTGAAALDESLSVEPMPGHTPGTIAIKLESKGEKALFCGDILHHALQVYRPSWNSSACMHAENARASRRKTLEQCAAGALLMPAHFGKPFACRIEAKGDAFEPKFIK
jgi:glyoxylase-like metal-dependent hydrolase (beta-lactamase superfamily II)